VQAASEDDQLHVADQAGSRWPVLSIGRAWSAPPWSASIGTGQLGPAWLWYQMG
jgi:hypothetical protein